MDPCADFSYQNEYQITPENPNVRILLNVTLVTYNGELSPMYILKELLQITERKNGRMGQKI